MSTLVSSVKSDWCQSEVSTERGRACEENLSRRRENEGGVQDAIGNKCVTGPLTEGIQTAENLHIRQRTLLKSKTEWVNTPENLDECLSQHHFTSFYSLRFPNTRRDEYRAKVRAATKLRSNDLYAKSVAGTKVAAEQHPEQFTENNVLFNASTGNTTKDDGVSESQTDDTSCSWGKRVEHDIFNHKPTDGIQNCLALCDQGQPAQKCTQGQSAGLRSTTSETEEGQSGVNDPLGQNVEGAISLSNLIHFRKDTGSKADTDCQVCACSLTAINQALSLPSFPSSNNGSDLKSDLISSTAAMFTSTLVSVLVPPWSLRGRRHKRELCNAGPDAQNSNMSALTQDEQQQRFPLQQIQAQGEMVNDYGNRLRGSTGTSRSSVEWQNESFSHVSESTKQFLKTSRMNRHVVDQRTESCNPIHMSVDSSEVPRTTLSLQLSDHRRMAQSVDQGESFSSLRSRPTTSTLLLSSRRLNSRKPIPETFRMDKQIPAPITSLNVPSKSIFKISQPQSNLVSTKNPTKETLARKNFFASCEQLSDTLKPKPLSPKWEEMELRKQRYLITGDCDITNRTLPATNDTSTERQFSNYAPIMNQSETLKSVQEQGAFERSISVNKNIQDSNSKILERSAWMSPQVNANRRFVFPKIPPDLNSDNILKRQVSKTVMMSPNPGHSISVQSDNVNNTNNTNRPSTINSSTKPRTFQSNSTNPSVSLTPTPLTQSDQNNIPNSSCLNKSSSSPVNSIRIRTFTENLSVSPRKDLSIEGTSPSHLWSNYLNSKRQQQETHQSPLDQPSHLSPSEFKPRSVCTPSIYKYLRETSPLKGTQASPALNSPSPQTSSLKQIQEGDRKSRHLWFTFDCSSVESNDPHLKNSCPTSVPQSLPPDTDRRSECRLSKSPYSTLISTRAAANSLSSPPVINQHDRSFSNDSSPVEVESPKVMKRSYTSVLRERLSEKKLGEPAGCAGIQLTKKTVCQDGISNSSADSKFPDSEMNALIPYATRPKQNDTVIKNIPLEGLNGKLLSHGDKSNTSATDSLRSKEISLSLGTSRVSEVEQTGGLTEISQANGEVGDRLGQASSSLNSRISLFLLRSKKTNVLTSSPSTAKEGVTVKKGDMPGPKPTKTVDQVWNRLKQTFGSKSSEDTDTPSRKTEEVATNVKPYESIRKGKESKDLTVKKLKAKEVLDGKDSERPRELDQTDDLTVRTPNKPGDILDSKAPERSKEQMDLLAERIKTKAKYIFEGMALESLGKLDQMDGLPVKRQTKEEILDSKGSERRRELDQMDDLMVMTQGKPEEVLDSKLPKASRELDKVDDPTVRRKIRTETMLDSTRSQKKSPKTPIIFMVDSYDSFEPCLDLRHENQDSSPNMNDHKRRLEEKINRFLDRPLSPNRSKPHNINSYATLPGKRSRLGTSPTLSPYEYSSDDELNDNVFFNNVLTKRNKTSLGESENVPHPENVIKVVRQSSTGMVMSSPCADIRYGLQRGRSFSVSSVVSGRPSGPGRISTGSRQGSVSDLSSLDGFMTKGRHSSVNSLMDSSENDGMSSNGYIPYKGPPGQLPSEGYPRSPDYMGAISVLWDMETNPTPPPSPPHSRRISQVSSPSPDSLSPRGFLPSKNYKSMLSVFEESSSETTTDDEYYLISDNDDEEETEV